MHLGLLVDGRGRQQALNNPRQQHEAFVEIPDEQHCRDHPGNKGEEKQPQEDEHEERHLRFLQRREHVVAAQHNAGRALVAVPAMAGLLAGLGLVPVTKKATSMAGAHAGTATAVQAGEATRGGREGLRDGEYGVRHRGLLGLGGDGLFPISDPGRHQVPEGIHLRIREIIHVADLAIAVDQDKAYTHHEGTETLAGIREIRGHKWLLRLGIKRFGTQHPANNARPHQQEGHEDAQERGTNVFPEGGHGQGVRHRGLQGLGRKSDKVRFLTVLKLKPAFNDIYDLLIETTFFPHSQCFTFVEDIKRQAYGNLLIVGMLRSGHRLPPGARVYIKKHCIQVKKIINSVCTCS